MIPASDHHTRSLLLRRVSSWSQQSVLDENSGEGESVFGSQQDYIHSLVQQLLPGFEFEQPPSIAAVPPQQPSTTTRGDSTSSSGNPRPTEGCGRSLPEISRSSDDDDGNNSDQDSLDALLASTAPAYEAETARWQQQQQSGHRRQRSSLFPHAKTRKNVKLYIVLVLLIIAGVSNVTLSKLQALPMYVLFAANDFPHESRVFKTLMPSLFLPPSSLQTNAGVSFLFRYNYPTFLNLYASFLYIPLSFAYIIPMSKFGSTIPSSHFTMNKWPFFVMGALDAISTCMQVLSSIYLPGKLLVLLPQAAIPISILMSSWILHEQFTRYQYVGALVVIGGILIVLFPIWTNQHAPDYSCQAIDEFHDDEDYCDICQMETNKEDCLSHNVLNTSLLDSAVTFMMKNTSSSFEEGPQRQLCQWISKDEALRHDDVLIFVWSLVMVASCLPMTFSSIYKQVALSAHANLDPLFVNGWVAIFQFLCALPLAIPAGLASSPSVLPWDLPQNWHHAWQCLFSSRNNLEGGCHPDQCEQAALWVHLGLVSSTSYAVLIIFMLKYGSSALLYMALTLMVPLGHLVFALHDPSNIRISDILGLFVLITGLVLYRFGHSDDEDGQPQQQQSPRQFGNSSSGGDAQGGYTLVGSNNRADNNNVEQAGNQESEGDMYFRFFREPFLLSGDV